MEKNKKGANAQGAVTQSVSKSQFITSLKNNAIRAEATGLVSAENVKKLKEIAKEAIEKHLGGDLFDGLV